MFVQSFINEFILFLVQSLMIKFPFSKFVSMNLDKSSDSLIDLFFMEYYQIFYQDISIIDLLFH